MADELTIMAELGEDTDLLLAPDNWLESKRIMLQQRMSLLAEELGSILSVQRIKRQLQQQNRVAIRCAEKRDGEPVDIIIKVCPINEAIATLIKDQRDKTIPSDVSAQNAAQHVRTWRADGYDVDTAEQMARRAI